jgi:hypothetical protein
VACCREHEVATSLELIKMLLREASGEDDPISDPEEYRQWLVVLLEAEDPSQVVGPDGGVGHPRLVKGVYCCRHVVLPV